MKFDSLGLPADSGATDRQDSIRLAAIMTVFSYPTDKHIFMDDYILPVGSTIPRYLVPKPEDNGVLFPDPLNPTFQCTHPVYVRHPDEYIYDLSRDQALCAFAAFRVQKLEGLVGLEFVNGKDIFWLYSGHLKRCKGLKASWLEDMILYGQIHYHAKHEPLEEPLQLLCMLMVADVKFLKAWCKANLIWRDSILIYLSGWRGEGELAVHIIKTIEEKIK